MSALTTRRAFLKTGAAAGAGLLISFHVPPVLAAPGAAARFAPNAFLRITPDGEVIFVYPRSEMGQGSSTGLAMALAEELEADWARIRVEQGMPVPEFGDMTTGGSTTIRERMEPVRKAGAQAREMLIAAAAARWKVPAAECRAEDGHVVHAGRGRLAYGALAAAAAKLPVPADPPLKKREQFRRIGTQPERLDGPAKVDGSARFGLDVRVPGMLVASIARCPVFGGKVAEVDPAAALAVPGVKRVERVGSGVAVFATDTWSALRGREALKVTWEEGALATLDSAAIRAAFVEAAAKPGHTARKEGDGAAALARAARTVEAVYEAPYLAHATLEPQNATAHVTAEGCELWVPSQSATEEQSRVAEALGIPKERVRVHVTFSGGGFGRRMMSDYAIQAALASKAAGVPVQVVWTREDDFRHDFYRPATYHVMRAGLDANGDPTAWSHRIVGPGIVASLTGRGAEMGLDGTSVMGAADLPYAIPHLEVDWVWSDPGIPIGWWRSVGSSQNAFVVEAFLDEVAHAAGRDPLAFRLALLAGKPRHRAALERAAKEAGWGEAPPPGRARGIAVHECFGSIAAHVAEVSVADARVRVHRVTCAVDCGLAVHPGLIAAQMEGAAIIALTATLKGGVTIERGAVAQTGFHDHPLLGIAEAPEVAVHIVPSDGPVGGIGEPGIPPVAPAVANAVAALTGQPVRALPIRL